MFTLHPAAAAAFAAAVFLAGVEAATFAPVIGANARVAREVVKTADWKRAQQDTAVLATAWARARGQSEGLRKLEAAQAIAAVSAQASSCDARIATARRSAAALSVLINKEPTRDPNGCPVRQLLDARQLRDALRPPPPR